MNKIKITDPLLALAFATVAERRREHLRLSAQIRKAANRPGFRRPAIRHLIGKTLTGLRALSLHVNETLYKHLQERGPELVRDRFFRKHVLELQTGYLHEQIGTCMWVDYLTTRKVPAVNDPTDYRLKKLIDLERDLQCFFTRRPVTNRRLAKKAA
jgi:hypothetical protein